MPPLTERKVVRPVHLADVPGHSRLRPKLEKFLPQAAGIVFVVDALGFLSNYRAVSESQCLNKVTVAETSGLTGEISPVRRTIYPETCKTLGFCFECWLVVVGRSKGLKEAAENRLHCLKKKKVERRKMVKKKIQFMSVFAHSVGGFA
ncbi:hypothetical protein EZV62_017573 [Acer yangbiense]|uniref:Uncharacterized protein n=1 Tax=Acer yangbiense TaxID=1000413 RepID=A0A5C7HGQ4_9ROSI|nr:hypothetical protein EZV62_017573 [Acer yangbiense]